MEKKDVVNFLKEETNVEWLEALKKFIGSHIECVKCMDDLESHLKQKEQN